MNTSDAIVFHEARVQYHMELARSYREQLDALERTDPEEYANYDREDTIGTQARHARWHNRMASLLRHEPIQASMFEAKS